MVSGFRADLGLCLVAIRAHVRARHPSAPRIAGSIENLILVASETEAGFLQGIYLEVNCTYNLLSNCSYNPNISPITTATLDIIGL